MFERKQNLFPGDFNVFLFSQSMADFHMDASKEGIEILGAESFVDNPITKSEISR